MSKKLLIIKILIDSQEEDCTKIRNAIEKFGFLAFIRTCASTTNPIVIYQTVQRICSVKFSKLESFIVKDYEIPRDNGNK